MVWLGKGNEMTEKHIGKFAASFSERCGEVSYVSTMLQGETRMLQIYIGQNPNHVGICELDLLSAERRLADALETVRGILWECRRLREGTKEYDEQPF
jgi:hypothetical protein